MKQDVSLADLLVTASRDRSGEETYARYEYQTGVGLALAFSLHDGHQDYAIAFEYIDDLLLLDSSSKPTKIQFYQIKSRSRGEWTIERLSVCLKSS